MTRRIPNPKNSAARSILRLALSYAASNPTANLPRLLRLARVAALKEDHRRQIDELQRILKDNPVIYGYATNLLQRSHPNVRERLIYNWFVH
ncbi:MAG: radical SAM protein, partial [Firmicutes bacterium]|nr:radical SAM protein [Bacillota bacterium]